MGQMTHNDAKWSDSNTQTTKNKTYTFPVGGKYVDKNIEFTISAQDGAISVSDVNLSGTNVILSSTNTSGVAVSASGDISITTPGWIDTNTNSTNSNSTKYLTKIELQKNKSFIVNDGIVDWTYNIDSNGNVSIY